MCPQCTQGRSGIWMMPGCVVLGGFVSLLLWLLLLFAVVVLVVVVLAVVSAVGAVTLGAWGMLGLCCESFCNRGVFGWARKGRMGMGMRLGRGE